MDPVYVGMVSEVGCGRRRIGRTSLESLGLFDDDDEYFDGGESPDDMVSGPSLMIGCGHVGMNQLLVGFSLGSITRSVSRAAKGAVHAVTSTAGKIPGVSPAYRTLGRVMRNPIVSTAWGQVTVPGNIALGLAKGGPKGALDAAKAELRNPVRRAAVTALGTVFPPAAPAAVALNAANVLLDSYESKDPVAAAKAVAQIASVAAGVDAGDPHMKMVADVITKANAVRKLIPPSATPALSNARAVVCGAKGEDQKGIWLKVRIQRKGPRMVATLYSVAAGDAEVSTFSVDLRPLAKLAKVIHSRMHSSGQLSKAGQRAALNGGKVSGMLDGLSTVVNKLGRQKLESIVASKTQALAARAGCNAQKPPAPVSDKALAAYAAARTGVEAVDNLARTQRAVTNSTSALKRYVAVKGALSVMSPAQKEVALRRTDVRKAVLDGVSAKAALAAFANADGPSKMVTMRQSAALAKSAFKNIQEKARAGDPEAKKMATVVSIAARTRAKIQDSAAASKGGLPGLVVGPNGRVKRGRFRKRAAKTGESSSVILTSQGQQTGVFDSVSGSDLVRDGANYLDNVAEDQLPFELSDDQNEIEGMGTKVCCYGG